MIAAGTAPGLTEGQIIGDFYAKYFSLANVLGLLLQLFVVSRIIKHRGVAWAVMVLPALSFGVYNILIFVPLLNAALAAKVVENSTDYSLNNTVRNMLFLPCTYEQKFAAKQAIDSFFVRMGDVLSAVLVFVGTTFLALPSRGFAAVNAALAVVALILAWRVGRHYKTADDDELQRRRLRRNAGRRGRDTTTDPGNNSTRSPALDDQPRDERRAADETRRLEWDAGSRSFATPPSIAAAPKFTSCLEGTGRGRGQSSPARRSRRCVISNDESLRMAGEEALVRDLTEPRPSRRRDLSHRAARRAHRRREGQGLVRAVRRGRRGGAAARQRREADHLHRRHRGSVPYYGTLWGYYGYGWSTVYVPGSVSRDTIVVVETTIYSVPRNALLWAAVSETRNPAQLAKYVEELTSASVKELQKVGLAKQIKK